MRVGVLLFEIAEGDDQVTIRETLGQASVEIVEGFAIMGLRFNYNGPGDNRRMHDFQVYDLEEVGIWSLEDKFLADEGTPP